MKITEMRATCIASSWHLATCIDTIQKATGRPRPEVENLVGRLFSERAIVDDKWEDYTGENIQAARQALKMTQAELARESGIYQSSISAFEKGKRTASLETLEKIAQAMQMEIWELI